MQQVRGGQPGGDLQGLGGAVLEPAAGERGHPDRAEAFAAGLHGDRHPLGDVALGAAVQHPVGGPEFLEEAALGHRPAALLGDLPGGDGEDPDRVEVGALGVVREHPGVRVLDGHCALHLDGDQPGQAAQVAERHVGAARGGAGGVGGPQGGDHPRPVHPGGAEQQCRAGLFGDRPQLLLAPAVAGLAQHHARHLGLPGGAQQCLGGRALRVDADADQQVAAAGRTVERVEHHQLPDGRLGPRQRGGLDQRADQVEQFLQGLRPYHRPVPRVPVHPDDLPGCACVTDRQAGSAAVESGHRRAPGRGAAENRRCRGWAGG